MIVEAGLELMKLSDSDDMIDVSRERAMFEVT